jgi:ubiquinone/menaquinone biosynthesis C-methylase UbiE
MGSGQNLNSDVVNYVVSEFLGVMSNSDLEKVIGVHLNEKEYEFLYQVLNQTMQCLHRDWGTVLDLGCGLGELTKVFTNHNVNIIGIEPSKEAIRIAKQKGLNHNLIRAVGEYLPLRDEYFHTVYSISTLEHVANPEKVIANALRVLKAGGTCLVYCPDYATSLYEEHYKIFWLPFLTNIKYLARFYVRLRGRKSDYVNTLNYITRQKLKKAFDEQEYIDLTSLVRLIAFMLKGQKLKLRNRLIVSLNKIGRIWLMVIKTRK